MAASLFAAEGTEALSPPTTAQALRRRDAKSCDVVVGAGRGSFLARSRARLRGLVFRIP